MKRPRFSTALLHSEQAGLLVALLLLCLVIFVVTPVFLTGANVKNVPRDASLVAIAGIGMVMIILLGEIDLSVGSTQALVGILAVSLLNGTESVFLALNGALAAGAGIGLITGLLVTRARIGLITGLLVTRARINSLIATLGMMAILRGTAMVSTRAVRSRLRSPTSSR